MTDASPESDRTGNLQEIKISDIYIYPLMG